MVRLTTGWIAVDFDGTLAHYEKWTKWNEFGPPIPRMVERVRVWLAEGMDVRVFTARIGLPLWMGRVPKPSRVRRNTCRLSGESFSDAEMMAAIQDWTLEHCGACLPVQCYKDFHMIELWDDRAVQVVPNTGRTLAEEAEAVRMAEAGKGPTMFDQFDPDCIPGN